MSASEFTYFGIGAALRPGEAKTLATIQTLRTAGGSFQAIADALIAEGSRPRRGDRWHRYAIARIAER
jgi:hypothetical protein